MLLHDLFVPSLWFVSCWCRCCGAEFCWVYDVGEKCCIQTTQCTTRKRPPVLHVLMPDAQTHARLYAERRRQRGDETLQGLKTTIYLQRVWCSD